MRRRVGNVAFVFDPAARSVGPLDRDLVAECLRVSVVQLDSHVVQDHPGVHQSWAAAKRLRQVEPGPTGYFQETSSSIAMNFAC